MGAGWAWQRMREKAKKDLADAQANGLERIVWDIAASAADAFPTQGTWGSGEGCKGSHEYVRGYLGRMAYDGEAFEENGWLYLTLDDIALVFALSTGRTDTVRERVRFFLDIAGEVEVRYSHLDLAYKGWLDSTLAPAETKAKRPYRTTCAIN